MKRFTTKPHTTRLKEFAGTFSRKIMVISTPLQTVVHQDIEKIVPLAVIIMIRNILRFFAIIIGVREAYRPYVDEGLVDFSGQGRDRYGK